MVSTVSMPKMDEHFLKGVGPASARLVGLKPFAQWSLGADQGLLNLWDLEGLRQSLSCVEDVSSQTFLGGARSSC